MSKQQLQDKETFLDSNIFKTFQNQRKLQSNQFNDNQQIHQEYAQFFKDIQKQDVETVQQLHSKLKENGFIISQPECQNQKYEFKDTNTKKQNINNFSIKAYPMTLNWEVVQLDCQLNIYKKRFLALNQKGQKYHDFKLISSGTIGKIYQYQNQTQIFAIKCIKDISGLLKNQQLSILGIKQYFIMAMMSALKIGPKIKSYAGFDFIISQNCLEFSMEKCKYLEAQHVTQNGLKHMKFLLKKMHSLNVIHFDIKPSNIMFSSIQQNIVFIDFGLSQIINQKIGKKTLTSFKGTVAYAGEQLRRCFTKKKPGLVDLYYNDVVCLKSTIFQLTKKQKKDIQNILQISLKYNFNENNSQLQKKIKIIWAKYCLVQGNMILANQIKTQQIQKQIYLFLTKLSPSRDYLFFCQNQLKGEKTSQQYLQFHSYYNLGTQILKQENNKIQFDLFQKFYLSLQDFKKPESTLHLKEKLKEFLLDEKNFLISNYSYFVSFIQYVSFCKNVLNTNLQQKYQVSLSFLSAYSQIEKFTDLQHFENFSQQITSQKLKIVIKCLNICMQIVEKNIQNYQFSNFYLDLLQQCVFLKINKYLNLQLSVNFTQIMKNTNKMIKKIQEFMRLSYGLIKYFRLEQQIFDIYRYDKQYYSQFVQKRFQYLHEQISHITSLQQKNFYFQLLDTIQNHLKIIFVNIEAIYFESQALQMQKFQLLIQKYKLKLNSQSYQALLQIIIFSIHSHRIFNESKLDIHFKTIMPSNLYNEINFNNIKHSNVLSRKDLGNILHFSISKKCLIMKQYLKLFDKKINCFEISDLYFTIQRLTLAFYQNIQDQIKKYSLQMFKQNDSSDKKQSIILKINCFSRFQKSSLIWLNNKQNLYVKIRKWVYSSVIQLSQKYFSRNNQKQIDKSFENFCLIIHAFYQLISHDTQFIDSQIISLRKLQYKFQQLYLKVQKKKEFFIQYINTMFEYFSLIQKDIAQKTTFIMDLFNQQKFQNLQISSNLNFLSEINEIRRLSFNNYIEYLQQARQNLIIYEAYTISDSHFLSSMQFKQLILSLCILKIQWRIVYIFTQLNFKLKQGNNKQMYYYFVLKNKKLIHPKSCPCYYNIVFHEEIQYLADIFIKLLLTGQISYNLHPYYSVPLTLYVLYIKQKICNEVKLKLLIFVAKSFSFLDSFTKKQLLQNYYKNLLDLSKYKSSKYYNIYKKYILSSKQQKPSFKTMVNTFFKVSDQNKSRKTQNIFQNGLLQKIKKLNKFLRFQQTHNSKQDDLRHQHFQSQRNSSVLFHKAFNSKQINQVNLKIKQLIYKLDSLLQIDKVYHKMSKQISYSQNISVDLDINENQNVSVNPIGIKYM